MSLNSGGGGNVGTIVQAGFALADALNRGKGWNKRDRRNLDAAVAAGYTVQSGRRGVPVVRDPVGNRITTADLLVAGKRIRTAPAPLPTPPIAPQPLPTGGDILDDLLKRPDSRIGRGPLPRTGELGRELFDELLRRPRTPTPEPSAPVKAGRVLGRVLGRVGGIIGGILYPSDLGDSDLYPPGTAIPLPQPDRPTGPPKRPVITRGPKDLPKQPGPSTGTVADRMPQPRAPGVAEPLPFPVVLPTRDPSPSTAKRPQPTTVPAPTASPVGLPSPLSFPFPLPSPRVNLQPRPIVSPLELFAPGRPGSDLARLAQPLPSPLTLTQTAPVGSPPSDRCSCPPKQKRKPSKPRTVCYSGGYREKARGIDKQPRRKIRCL